MARHSEALGQSVYAYLLDQIMTGELAPGDRIPEASVAENYGISRTPVRDAMRRLNNEGIIQIFPKRFAKVSEYSERDIQEVGYMRVALDQMAMRMASRYGNLSDYEDLEALANACLDAHAAGDRLKRTTLDAQFHMKLAAISGNQLLLKFQKEINIRVEFILNHYRTNWENEAAHLHQHVEMVDCLKKHDVERGLQLISDHLVKFYNL